MPNLEKLIDVGGAGGVAGDPGLPEAAGTKFAGGNGAGTSVTDGGAGGGSEDDDEFGLESGVWWWW